MTCKPHFPLPGTVTKAKLIFHIFLCSVTTYFDLILGEESAELRLRSTERSLRDSKDMVIVKVLLGNYLRLPPSMYGVFVSSTAVCPLVLSNFPGPRSAACLGGRKIVAMNYAILSKYYGRKLKSNSVDVG
jgi:hypothetical protein